MGSEPAKDWSWVAMIVRLVKRISQKAKFGARSKISLSRLLHEAQYSQLRAPVSPKSWSRFSRAAVVGQVGASGGRRGAVKESLRSTQGKVLVLLRQDLWVRPVKACLVMR